jgi:demethylspheroidene O-methyltransferase
MTAMDLDLFMLLYERGGVSLEDVCSELGIDTNIGHVFLNILESFGYIIYHNGRLYMTELAKSIMPKYNNMKSWNEEMKLTYDSLVDFTEILKTGDYKLSGISKYWAYKKTLDRKNIDFKTTQKYSLVMDTSEEEIAKRIAEKIDFSSYSHLVDFGGGYGRFAITIAKKYLNLKVTVVDLPSVCSETNRIITKEGLEHRVKAVGMDFFSDPLPRNVDIISFIRVLHDWDDEQAKELLERACYILDKNGTILISEPMNREDREIDKSSSLSTLMLSLMGGRRRKVSEYSALLHSLGFNETICVDLDFSIFTVVLGRDKSGYDK